MAYEQEKKDLAAQMWKRFEATGSQLDYNRTLTRTIGTGAKGYDSKIKLFLDSFVDPTGIETDSDGNLIPRAYVDDPIADQVIYPGRWHLVSNAWNPQLQKFAQVLKFGWANTTPEATARMGGIVRHNQSGKLTITRKWLWVNPDLAKTLLTVNDNPKVLANVVTDPMIDGKLYEGDWLAKVTSAPMTETDGIVITQELVKAGDQRLTVILGTDKMTSSRECYFWQTTAADIELFRTHSAPYDTEFDYKWDAQEVGIQKVWGPPQQNDDYSLNLVAKYIVKTAWNSPDNGTDFVIQTNLNGIYTEAVKQFRNRNGMPVANPGELVKAVANEVGLFDGEVTKQTLLNGNNSYLYVASSIIEWHEDGGQMRYPIWSISTDSNTPPKITGYVAYAWKMFSYRKVNFSITHKYTLSHPNVTAPTDASITKPGVGTFSAGGGVSRVNEVLELIPWWRADKGQVLFALEEKVTTVDDWTVLPAQFFPLYSESSPVGGS